MKHKRVNYDYGECHVCGADMSEGRIKQEFWVKGKLVVVEDVPAGICPQCGEKVVKGTVGRRIAKLLTDGNRLKTARTIDVPVLRLSKDTA